MTPPTRAEWMRRVQARARNSRAPLSPATIEELATHLEDLYLTAIDGGATHAEALCAADAAVASLDPRDRSIDALVVHTPHATTSRSSGMFASLRMAIRQFRQHPAFALITVLVLGLGTGAAAAIYTIVDTVVLRPLPFREPDRLVALWDSNAAQGLKHEPISPVTFMDYRGMTSFEGAAAWWRPDVNVVDPGLEPARVTTVETSANLFTVLGVSPQLGPGFAYDGGPLFSRTQGVVISDRLWRTRYNADPSIVGRQLKLNDEAWTVLGVMPAGFNYPGGVDVWQQLRWDLTQHSRNAHFMEAVARLAPGATLTTATSEARALASRLGAQFAASNGGWQYQLVPLLDDQLGYYRPALLVLFGAVGVLLLIGCLNVASLLLTRALARDREMAVRFALGASTRHVVAQLLMESLVLSTAGAAVGLVFAAAAVPALVALAPVPIPRLADAAVSARAFLFSGGLIVFTTLIFGFVPAAVLLRRRVAPTLRAGERGSSRGVRRMHHVLVVGEVALACALLIGSALLIRSVARMTAVPTGVDGRDVTITSVQLSGQSYERWTQVAETDAALLAAIRQQPGVRAAGVANFLPFEPGWRDAFYMNGARPASRNDAEQAQHLSVSDGYFDAMGARVLAGRAFSDRDVAAAEGAVVVNETFARRHGGMESIVGQQLTTFSGQIGPLGRNLMARRVDDHWDIPSARIVGVVADIRNTALGQPVEPAIYFPMSQYPFRAAFIAIAARDQAAAISAVGQALKSVAPDTPMGPAGTWTHRVELRSAEPRLLMTVLTAFGVLSALLAALGIYGLFSWLVAVRQRELAIRMTLGARPGSVGAAVLGRATLLVLFGLLTGWALLRLVAGPLSTVLFDVAPGDAASTLTAAGVLLLASMAACAPAAWRAMRIDPVSGLRAE